MRFEEFGEDSNLVKEYIEYLLSTSISERRCKKIFCVLKTIKELFLKKNFKDITQEDIKKTIIEIDSFPKYKNWTKYDKKVVLKKFLRWINKQYGKNLDISFIKCSQKNNSNKLPEELLTIEEVEKLISVCDNIRDKCFISILYESGARIGELISLKIKDIQFDQYGAILIVNGKTGMRRIRVVGSAPYLRDYLDSHPFKHDPNYPLWIRRRKPDPLDSGMIRKLLRIIGKKSGIRKKLYPHLFRHSRATHLAKHLTEAQMKEYFGWIQNSKMASTYVHLSGRDVDDALLKLYGIKIKEEDNRKNLLTPIICSKCGEVNSPFNSICKCGNVLKRRFENFDYEKFEMLLLKFLIAISEKYPEIKKEFIKIVKEEKVEEMFR